jgi:hypothetical protein
MDVLTVLRRRWWWVALAAWLAAAACLNLQPARRAEPSFPHRVHVQQEGLECSFCHGQARAAERPGMPPPELCAPCHDRIDADKPPERRAAAFFGEAGRYRTVADAALPADVRFSHRAHVTEAGLACERCHHDVARQDEVPLAPLVQKTACMQCHADHGRANECSECHAVIDRTWRPPSHDGAFELSHGELARSGSEGSAGRCVLCHHGEQDCTSCHRQRMPRSHDQTFRVRTHGIEASIDRSRCMVCHTRDSCQQCHQETRPRSHRGGFGAPQHRHCTSCHFPLANEGCAGCHKATPGHDLATPLPADHNAAMNCRLCHGNGVALPHPDGGHVCTTCHR